MKTMLELIKLKHWIKNFFILAPLFFAIKLFDPESVLLTLAAFVSFSFISVFVYIFNDIIDLEKDSAHPKKKIKADCVG